MDSVAFHSEMLAGYCPTGFLDRAGRFYRCERQGHRLFAPELFAHLYPQATKPQNAERWFINQGWTKLSSGRLLYAPQDEEMASELEVMSEAQLQAVIRWQESGEQGFLYYNLQECTLAEFLARQVPFFHVALPKPTTVRVPGRGQRPSST
jgi:hypothetical protein